MTVIVLVGLMGTGKSTVGGVIAKRCGRKLVDSDQVIEESTMQTVRELWESGGEVAYRALESKVVLDALEQGPPVVIAAPGGVVLDPRVRDALAEAFVVWLRARPETLAGRVEAGDHRPLLDNTPVEAFSAMANERSELYARVADLVIDVDSMSPQRCADVILEHFELFAKT